MNSRSFTTMFRQIHFKPRPKVNGRLLVLGLLTAALFAVSLLDATPGLASGQAPQAKPKAAPAQKVLVVAPEPEEEITEQQFDMSVFRQDGNASTARARLISSLTLQADDIERACQLTSDQKQKLLLVGRGDIPRFFSRYDSLKTKFLGRKSARQNLEQVLQETDPIASTLQAGLFREGSLFHKSLPSMLSAEQSPRYHATVQERVRYRHLATIKLLVSSIEQGVPLLEAQRQKLLALLERETKPARKPGPYDFYYVSWQLSQFPEEKIRPLFDGAQWKALNQIFIQYQAIEPALREAGYFSKEDDEDEKSEARAAGVKK